MAVALLAICALGGMMASDTDGAVVSSSFDMGTAYKGEYFSSTKTQALYDFGENMEPTGISVSGSTTQYGLTVSVSQEDAGSYAPEVTVSVSGTPTQTGTISWNGKSNYFCTNGDTDEYETFTVSVTVIEASTPVTSISISGSSSVTKGSSTTLTASVSPSNATDRSVTWSIQSGSSYVSISSSGTSCTVTGKAAGSAVIKCTANDGSGKSATKTITVSSGSSSYLPSGVSSGSGTSSDPYVFRLSAGTSYSLNVSPVGTFTSYSATSGSVTIPGITFSTTSGGSVSTLTTLSGGQMGSMSISGTPTSNGTWDIKASNPSVTKYYRIVVTGGSYEFSLVYDANGGSNGPSDAEYTSSSSTYKATISSTKPSKTGYAFLGWSKSSDADSATYQPGDSITLSYGTTTLYAVWKENKQNYYAYLYYNANGGSGAPSTQSDSIYASSASGSKTFTISSTKPTKSGYTFLGWSESSSASSASYQPGSSISVSYGSSKTLYAVWKDVAASYKCNLYFDANGGSGEPTSMSYTGVSTSAHTFTIPSVRPYQIFVDESIWYAFEFLGWSESETASTASYQPGSTISVAYNGSKTLYAVWGDAVEIVDRGTIADGGYIEIPVNEVSKLTIEVAKNNGGYMEAVDGEDWVQYDTERGTGTVIAAPTETGPYSFTVRVYAPGVQGEAYISYSLEVVDATSEQEWYAYLYYNANGGSGAPSTQSDSIYASSASGSKSFTISSTKPTKSGYTFLGWSTSSGASSASYQPGSAISVSYGSSKTLYAVWEQTKYTSTLNFSANGGSGAPSSLTDTHTSTSAHTFTISSTKPTKSGFVFLGWSESSTATSASYQPGSTISVAYNGTKTLYAVWQTAQLDITSEPATKSLKVGQSWSYTPTTNVSGCTVSVSGASWLSVSNGKIGGTPTAAGTYSITVTVSKTGYTSDTQTFTLKVYSALGFNSVPGASGMFAYAE